MNTFRFDINALRAIAVALVILFHMGVPVLAGGFVGVDIFFVISGYLMTQILVKRTAVIDSSDTFLHRLLGFYVSRANRIVPALTVVCLTVLVIGFIWLDPLAYEAQCRSMFSSLLFYSNIYSYQRSGYFSPEADSNSFLHTWSLSVEWQFYIIYPLFIGICRRFFQRQLLSILLSALTMSFFLSVALTYAKPSAAFYLLPTRAWEMLAGGALVLLPDHALSERARRLMLTVGLVIIGCSAVYISSLFYWPAAWAAIPVLGTVLVIYANASGWWCANAAVSTSGRLSYSLYLWHWPLIVFRKYFELPVTGLTNIVMLAIMVALSAMSYHFVEQRGRKLLDLNGCFLCARSGWAVFGYLAVVGFAAAIAEMHGIPSRSQQASLFADLREATADWDYPKTCDLTRPILKEVSLETCMIGSKDAAQKILFIGDSYVQQLYPRYRLLAQADHNFSLKVASVGGCPPIPGSNRIFPGFHCDIFFDEVRKLVTSEHFDTVLVSSMWYPYFRTDAEEESSYSRLCFQDETGVCRRASSEADQRGQFRVAIERLGRFLAELQIGGAKVIVLLRAPYSDWNVPFEASKRLYLGKHADNLKRISRATFREAANWVDSELITMAAKASAVVFDPTEDLCRNGACVFVTDEGVSVYSDRAHMRASYIVRAPLERLDELIFDRRP